MPRRPFVAVTIAGLVSFANTGGAQTLHTHEVTLAGGALAGDAATVAIDVAAPPTLTAATPKLDVQISGDVDEAELTRIAESLVR